MSSTGGRLDAATVNVVRAVYRDVSEVLQNHELRDEQPRDEQRKAAVMRRLLELVSGGQTERDELRSKLLAELPLG
jgi:hypothetical protein